MKATSGESASVVRWPPAPSPGGVIGLIAIIFCLFFAILSALSMAGDTVLALPRIVALVLVIIFMTLAGLFGFLVYGYATMRYELTADQLTIRWARTQHDIPIRAVQEIVPAVERLDPNPPGWQRFWPGYYVGEQATLSGLVTIVATLRARRQLLLVTRDYQFAISPERPVLFLEAFAQLRCALQDASPDNAAEWQPAALTARFVEAGWTTPYPSVHPKKVVAGTTTGGEDSVRAVAAGRSAALPRLWSDPIASGLLIAALVIDIALTLFIFVRYNSFPQTLAIHWNSSGVADRFAPVRQIWSIPLITWLVTIANVAFAWFVDAFDRFAARFLLAASLAVEFAALIALYWLIH
jgi:uncharacterized protein DUF1648/PH (Pleckstrin Homology) domain-containing protein